MTKRKKFFYIYDRKLVEISTNIPNIGNRAAAVHCLIISYNLLSKCKVCGIREATDEDLFSFHTQEYIEFLKRVQSSNDLERMIDSNETVDFNLAYDCPLFQRMYDFSKIIAGSSLTAAHVLVKTVFQVKKKIEKNVFKCSKPKSYLQIDAKKMTYQESNKKDIFEISNNLTLDEENLFKENFKKENGHNIEKTCERLVNVFTPDSNVQPICINWFGGWHHAQRDEAGGFCYVNDIVIAIHYLLKYFKRILYIDLDVHHGDGVENAFLFSSRVLTLSLHKYETGFFPGTGSASHIGEGNGKFYSINVPLKSGITDDKYFKVFQQITAKILNKYHPQCVVIQCGADCLPGDPLGGFNLTPVGMGKCLKSILEKQLPTLLLGGGGYHIANTSRYWAYLTSIVLENPISNDIPENSFLHIYGPDFELNITPSLRKDENTNEYLQAIVSTILQNLENMPDHSDLRI